MVQTRLEGKYGRWVVLGKGGQVSGGGRSFVVKWVTVACRKKVTEIILFIEMNVKSVSARRYARYVVTRQGLENKGPFTSRTSCLCSPSSKIGSSPLKGCGGNCRSGGK